MTSPLWVVDRTIAGEPLRIDRKRSRREENPVPMRSPADSSLRLGESRKDYTIYLILLSVNGYYCLLLGFTGFYWVLLGFTGFLSNLTWLCLVLLGSTGFLASFIGFAQDLTGF